MTRVDDKKKGDDSSSKQPKANIKNPVFNTPIVTEEVMMKMETKRGIWRFRSISGINKNMYPFNPVNKIFMHILHFTSIETIKKCLFVDHSFQKCSVKTL